MATHPICARPDTPTQKHKDSPVHLKTQDSVFEYYFFMQLFIQMSFQGFHTSGFEPRRDKNMIFLTKLLSQT